MVAAQATRWMADLFWPCFGLATAIGVVLVSLRRHNPNATRHWLMATLWLQAVGVFSCLLGSSPGLALGVILWRHAVPGLHAAGDATLAGLLTACFAVGQLSGPLLAALSSHFSGGLQPALVFAGCGLLVAGGLLLRPVKAARGLCASDGAPTAQR
ncbi:YbfB/YjiJ family MFS transporter [Pseudomonas sp. AL03]|uniref:YbfB/YjiJ family MFS transporter n=1 Tax=Pseudomonas sp. AL03 TaxID=3042230 RepID=UPI00249C35CF|nr:YbfB/YjiJ family MFS transporter [Pseudomonas sp. AL03]MDI3274825.1 YbfB/YjiJ family MFS transporter [Pseudomonas sp. AL03]